jgi:HTH-type transcriptional regulator/antitoxin HigA
MSQSKQPVAEVFAPGEFLREELAARGWTQGDLAGILGRPTQAINAIVKGRKVITPETAVGLGAAFGTSPEYWLNLETAFQLAKVGPADPVIEERARECSRSSRRAEATGVRKRPVGR